SSMGSGGDRIVFIPVSVIKEKYLNSGSSYTIDVGVSHPELLDPAIDEATALFRRIRQLKVHEETNFEIVKSDSLATSLIDNLKYLTFAATIIGLITLLGAAIGLLNIMLVSVTERTREIGTRKALGATPQAIMTQFLIEAITICQLGGILGILGGITAGNLVSSAIGGGFIIPWAWIILGVSLCFVVGVIAGFYPARKAAKLDPIESLRFE
ncbi:MAG: FtsX-like permease family protein, partial [Bacteroidota bacterium]|nr:FtsX-like permease family protein [Bacteroidota bacterium]MDX5431313.1 FtsX-like permease family protein [Bacteroidota bacterium]MDX5470051.1 FtsX-like permease family protein [Bacteroidota bacterium]